MVKNKHLKRKPTPLLSDKKAPESKQMVEEPESSDEEVNISVKKICFFFFIENLFFRNWF